MSPFFHSGATDTYYEDHGDAGSYPVVLVHPIGGNILIWHREIPLLLDAGFRVVAYEIRGHHRTAMGRANAYAMQDLADDLHALVEHLKISRCTIIGHSIGGIIGSMYAALHPEKVDALVLINSSPRRFEDGDLEKHFQTRRTAITQGMAALAESTVEKMEAKDLLKDSKYVEFFKEVFTKTSVEGFVAATVALYSIPEGLVQRLRATGCRVLAIVGSDDRVFMRLLKETKEEMPEMELRVLQGSDHWVVIEKPKEMYDILIEFITRGKKDGPPPSFAGRHKHVAG